MINHSAKLAKTDIYIWHRYCITTYMHIILVLIYQIKVDILLLFELNMLCSSQALPKLDQIINLYRF